jgi:GNAT superfamily N-acetyltransferase
MVRQGTGQTAETESPAVPLTGTSGPGRDPFHIESVAAAATRPLRRRLLRPHQQEDELVYPGDDDPKARHYAAMIGGEIVGIASVAPVAPDDDRIGGADTYRLRGMATVPTVRGRGIGTSLLDHVIGHVAAAGGDMVWCTARAGAVGFYRSRGFEVVGDPFELPDIGPHVIMVRPIGE